VLFTGGPAIPNARKVGVSVHRTVILRLHDEANVFKIHVHDVSSKFASCLLHRVNRVLLLQTASVVNGLNVHDTATRNKIAFFSGIEIGNAA